MNSLPRRLRFAPCDLPSQPLQCFPPAKLRCDVSASNDKDGSGYGRPTIRAAPIIAEVNPFASSGGGDIVGVDLISCRARKLYLRQCFSDTSTYLNQTFASLDAAPGTYCERGAPGRTPTASPLTSLQLRCPAFRPFAARGRPRRAGVARLWRKRRGNRPR